MAAAVLAAMALTAAVRVPGVLRRRRRRAGAPPRVRRRPPARGRRPPAGDRIRWPWRAPRRRRSWASPGVHLVHGGRPRDPRPHLQPVRLLRRPAPGPGLRPRSRWRSPRWWRVAGALAARWLFAARRERAAACRHRASGPARGRRSASPRPPSGRRWRCPRVLVAAGRTLDALEVAAARADPGRDGGERRHHQRGDRIRLRSARIGLSIAAALAVMARAAGGVGPGGHRALPGDHPMSAALEGLWSAAAARPEAPRLTAAAAAAHRRGDSGGERAGGGDARADGAVRAAPDRRGHAGAPRRRPRRPPPAGSTCRRSCSARWSSPPPWPR